MQFETTKEKVEKLIHVLHMNRTRLLRKQEEGRQWV